MWLNRAVYRNFAKGGRIWDMEKRGGRKLTIVLCEAQGGCYTLHLIYVLINFKNFRNVRGGGENNTRGGE